MISKLPFQKVNNITFVNIVNLPKSTNYAKKTYCHCICNNINVINLHHDKRRVSFVRNNKTQKLHFLFFKVLLGIVDGR